MEWPGAAPHLTAGPQLRKSGHMAVSAALFCPTAGCERILRPQAEASTYVGPPRYICEAGHVNEAADALVFTCALGPYCKLDTATPSGWDRGAHSCVYEDEKGEACGKLLHGQCCIALFGTSSDGGPPADERCFQHRLTSNHLTAGRDATYSSTRQFLQGQQLIYRRQRDGASSDGGPTTHDETFCFPPGARAAAVEAKGTGGLRPLSQGPRAAVKNTVVMMDPMSVELVEDSEDNGLKKSSKLGRTWAFGINDMTIEFERDHHNAWMLQRARVEFKEIYERVRKKTKTKDGKNVTLESIMRLMLPDKFLDYYVALMGEKYHEDRHTTRPTRKVLARFIQNMCALGLYSGATAKEMLDADKDIYPLGIGSLTEFEDVCDLLHFAGEDGSDAHGNWRDPSARQIGDRNLLKLERLIAETMSWCIVKGGTCGVVRT